jgi:hypothetical protein
MANTSQLDPYSFPNESLGLTFADLPENAAPGTPAANVGRVYTQDNSGVTTLYFADNAGAVTDLVVPSNNFATGNLHGGWFPFSSTFTYASASTFTVTDNAANQEIFTPGTPFKFRQTAGTWKYGIVTDYTTGTVTFSGAELTAVFDDELQYGDYSRVENITFAVNGTYGDGTTVTLLAEDLLMKYLWRFGDAYLVRAGHIHLVDDTTTNPDINVLVNGSTVFDTDDATALTWQYFPNTEVNETNYLVNLDDPIEIEVATAGVTGDAANLTVQLTFVLE